MGTIKMYYWLAKPGIVYGNALAAMAGFLFASSKGEFDLALFVALTLGISLVISSACVLNNYIDRAIDSKMKRTKKRAIVSGAVSVRAAIIYSTVLGLAGLGLLIFNTNWLTVALAAFAYFAYIVLYGIAKRKTVHGTLVGTISGSLPPVVGYVAVTNGLDIAALLLFLIFVCWQMPHFYAIAMRRHDEYAAAGIPVMPIVRGMHTTKVQILQYIAVFIIANSLLAVYGYVGRVYLLVMTALGLIWIAKGIKGFNTDDNSMWAKKMFLFSLIVLLVLCVMIAVGGLLP